MNYIIYDLEATCWEGNALDLEQETIEIGAILLNDYGENIGSFNRFVKPILHPYLSPFCSYLTSIEQSDVNRASTFPKVIEEFKDWAGIYDTDYILCSWGNFDKIMFERDCTLHQIEFDWCEHHINLKKQYQNFNRLKKPIGLKSAVTKEGFDFDGIHHRAISDAENLTKIFLKHFDVWQVEG